MVGSREGEDPMALSEDEQRKLEEIERALHCADPGFAGTLNLARGGGIVGSSRR